MNTPTEGPSSKPPRKKGGMEGLYHGLQFAVTTMAGLAAGYWLDQRFLPMPLGTLGGLLIGAVVGMINLARALK